MKREHDLIKILSENSEGLTVKELVEKYGFTLCVYRTIKNLQKNGVIERVPSKENAAKFRVTLPDIAKILSENTEVKNCFFELNCKNNDTDCCILCLRSLKHLQFRDNFSRKRII